MMRQSSISCKFKNLPWSLFVMVWLLCALSIAELYSAGGMSLEPWAWKQMTHVLIFSTIALLVAIVDLKWIYTYSYLIYAFSFILLLLVEVVGHTAMGATRWIYLGPIRLQPAELMKIAIILMMARFYSDNISKDFNKLSNILPLVTAVLMPVILIIKQPDLGTGILTCLAAASVFYIIGVSLKKFMALGVIICAALPVIWNSLRGYQQQRVMIFLNPEHDKLGAGYNIIQSKIAIGSGGMMGKGFGAGTQSNLSFLPEHQTDFIFASLAEEFGFVGCMLLICMYLLIIFRAILIANDTRSIFGRVVALGIISIFFWHIFINIAMVMGVVPVVGVPLPLISYGGTMVGSMLIGFGLVANISLNKNFIRR